MIIIMTVLRRGVYKSVQVKYLVQLREMSQASTTVAAHKYRCLPGCYILCYIMLYNLSLS